MALSSCSSDAEQSIVTVDALLGGTPIEQSSPTEPIVLDEGGEPELTMLVANAAAAPVEISSVELEGRALGLAFFTSRTTVGATIQPGDERLIRFPVDVSAIDGQAYGLLRGRLVLRGTDGQELIAHPVILDGQGSATSTMTLLTVALFAVGAVGLAVNVSHFLNGRLREDPRSRGLQLLPMGVAFGLGVSLAFSTLRVWPLSTPAWLLITIFVGLACYVGGMLLPPLDEGLRFPTIDLTDDHRAPITIAIAPAADEGPVSSTDGLPPPPPLF